MMTEYFKYRYISLSDVCAILYFKDIQYYYFLFFKKLFMWYFTYIGRNVFYKNQRNKVKQYF